MTKKMPLKGSKIVKRLLPIVCSIPIVTACLMGNGRSENEKVYRQYLYNTAYVGGYNQSILDEEGLYPYETVDIPWYITDSPNNTSFTEYTYRSIYFLEYMDFNSRGGIYMGVGNNQFTNGWQISFDGIICPISALDNFTFEFEIEFDNSTLLEVASYGGGYDYSTSTNYEWQDSIFYSQTHDYHYADITLGEILEFGNHLSVIPKRTLRINGTLQDCIILEHFTISFYGTSEVAIGNFFNVNLYQYFGMKIDDYYDLYNGLFYSYGADTATFEDTISVLFLPAESFLATEIFPDFTVGSFLMILVAVLIFGVFLKTFVGG